MNVQQLILALQAMPAEAEVLGISDSPEMPGETVLVRKIFRDMMDRTDYAADVYHQDSRGTGCVVLGT